MTSCGDKAQQDAYAQLADLDDVEDRVAHVMAFSDATLLYYYDQLHSPTLSPSPWIGILEDEVRRRNLRAVS